MKHKLKFFLYVHFRTDIKILKVMNLRESNEQYGESLEGER